MQCASPLHNVNLSSLYLLSSILQITPFAGTQISELNNAELPYEYLGC